MIKIPSRAEAKKQAPEVTALENSLAQTQKALAELAQLSVQRQQKKVLVAEIERDPTTEKMTRVIITVQ